MQEIAGSPRTQRLALHAIEDRIGVLEGSDSPAATPELVVLAEQVLEHWIVGRGEVPTDQTREGFRLLALHRQGARGDASFNACRETCRELAYHHNLVQLEREHVETPKRIRLAAMLAKHLCLFVAGKMQVAGLGEFCCSSRPLRSAEAVE